MNLSPEDGWVDAQRIRSVFTIVLRQLDELLPRSERLPIKAAVMELVERARADILKHRVMPEDFPKAPGKRQEPTPDSAAAHKARVDGIKGRS